MESGLNTNMLNTILVNPDLKQKIQNTDAYLSFREFQNRPISWKTHFDPDAQRETELYQTLIETISDLISDYIQEELIMLCKHTDLLELIH